MPWLSTDARSSPAASASSPWFDSSPVPSHGRSPRPPDATAWVCGPDFAFLPSSHFFSRADLEGGMLLQMLEWASLVTLGNHHLVKDIPLYLGVRVSKKWDFQWRHWEWH